MATPIATTVTMPKTIALSLAAITRIATLPDSAMVAGIERSMLPGPLVTTSICPKPTSTVNTTNADAAESMLAACLRPARDRWPRPPAPHRRPTRATACRESQGLLSSPCSPAPKYQTQRQHGDQNHALKTNLPFRCDLQKGKKGRCQRQRDRAENGANRRDAATDKLASAQNHAGHRQQRVAQCDIGIG